jgi:hypothetical protein
LVETFTVDDGKRFSDILILTCILRVISISGYHLGIDDEVMAIKGAADWWLSIGRWGAAFLERFLIPYPVVPFATSLLFCFSLAVAYQILCSMHAVSNRLVALGLLPIFILYPTWAFIEAFYGILPAVSLGLLFTVLSAYLALRYVLYKSTPASHLVSALVLLTTAIGCYQSFVLLYISICSGACLCGKDIDKRLKLLVSKSGIIAIAICPLIAAASSVFLAWLCRQLAGVSESQYLEEFTNPSYLSNSPLHYILSRLIDTPLRYYFGDPHYYGSQLHIIGVVLILSFALFLIKSLQTKQVLLRTPCFFLLLVSPFLFSLLGEELPTRSLFSLPYVAWCLSVILLGSTFGNHMMRRRFALVVSTLLAIFIQQIIYLNGTYFGSSILAREHDSRVASEIYYRISLMENGLDNDSDIQLGVKGRLGYSKLYPTGAGSTLGESFFDWDNGNPDRIVSFMKLIGYSNVSFIPKERLRDYEGIFSSMGEWPSGSSIKKVGDGLFLLKLSDD